jgi:large subunit ribosomal protein L28
MPPTFPIARCVAASRVLTQTSTPAVRRALSTTPRTLYKQPRVPDSSIPIPSATAKAPEIPLYPYGERQFYKQSNTGLYGSQRIRFGNNVSTKHEVKTRRKWRPNVQSKRLWSDALGVFVRTRITTRVLRTVDKEGGLDNYLLGNKAARIRDLGPWGWRLRWRLMQSPAIKARFAAQRAALGLPPLEGDEAVAAMETADGLTDGMSMSPEAMAETEAMLQGNEEFVLGDEAEMKIEADETVPAEDMEAEAKLEEPREGGFMAEEHPKKP